MSTPGTVVFVARTGERAFSKPVGILVATRLTEVKDCLRQVAEKVGQGLYAAGFVAYEAAPAFDTAFCAHPPGELPLVWFGLYNAPARLQPKPEDTASFQIGPWQALVSAADYHRQVGHIRELIVAGDTYQVNYAFPLQADFQGDTTAWFRQLCASQQADHCAFIQAGRFHLLCASPELFFKKEGEILTTRPMKGTARRGRRPAEDLQMAQMLVTSDKERAENIMIVDVLRNDMSRISRPDSVKVTRLCALERYPTVWQMTSTVVAQSQASLQEIMAALFPSGSVTGAPKIRATEIIRACEPHPRGVYCGAIGWCAPDGRAEFNVAIRTVTVDTQAGTARYHVGGGITHGSAPHNEYAECLTKAEVLTRPLPDFELLESLCWDGGYCLLGAHLDRMAQSAVYFDFAFNRMTIEKALNQYHLPMRAETSGRGPAPVLKVRLRLNRAGRCLVEGEWLCPTATLRVGLAAKPVDEDQIWLYHKTTCREIYRQALQSRPDCDDVILWNRRDELTESTMANLVLEFDGRLWTPPVNCGLLAGTFRQHLLEAGVLQEKVLRRSDLYRSDAIHLINSVRRWIKVQWVEQA